MYCQELQFQVGKLVLEFVKHAYESLTPVERIILAMLQLVLYTAEGNH